MTKKDFEFFAEFVVDNDLNWGAVDNLVVYFTRKNPRFCEERFRKAIKAHADKQQEIINGGN